MYYKRVRFRLTNLVYQGWVNAAQCLLSVSVSCVRPDVLSESPARWCVYCITSRQFGDHYAVHNRMSDLNKIIPFLMRPNLLFGLSGLSNVGHEYTQT